MNIVVASSEADAQAAPAVEQHHAAMAGELTVRVDTVLNAAGRAADEEARTTTRSGTPRSSALSTAYVPATAWC